MTQKKKEKKKERKKCKKRKLQDGGVLYANKGDDIGAKAVDECCLEEYKNKIMHAVSSAPALTPSYDDTPNNLDQFSLDDFTFSTHLL